MLLNPEELRDHRRHHYNTERVMQTRTVCRLRVALPLRIVYGRSTVHDYAEGADYAYINYACTTDYAD